MIRHTVDVYVDGQARMRNGTFTVQGDIIRVTGASATMRFTEAELKKETTATLAYLATNENGKRVDIAVMARKGCGCGK